MSNRSGIFEYFKALTQHWLGAMSGAFSVPFTVAAGIFDNKLATTISIIAAVACAGFAGYRAWATERDRAANAEERADALQAQIDSKSAVYLDIKDIIFDPNGPKEMYVECIIENSGRPTILKNWYLKIQTSKSEENNFVPRWYSTGKCINDPVSGIMPEDLSVNPLEEGGSRSMRLGFTISDVVPKENFGQPGTRFTLSAQDVKNRPIEASFSMPLKEN